MRQVLPILAIAMLFACSESAPPDELTSSARSSLQAGDPDAAIATLREAVRAKPNDASIRLLLAEAYLELGDGRLTLATLDQAVERGLDPDRAALPYARALYVDKQYDALLVRAIPPGLEPAEHVQFLYLQAEARAALSPADSANDESVRGYIELFADIDERPGDSEVADIAGKLDAARRDRDDIDRAWQHFRCTSEIQKPVGWEPVTRPGARVLRVGRERPFKTISAAARTAKDGDVVEIDPGTYRGDVALWPQNSLIVRGVGERPVVIAEGRSVKDRDVWLFTGNDVVIENVEISGARSPWENGAGIRHIGTGLTLRHVYLHDNENGVLTGNRYPDTNEVLIEFSEFGNNGDSKGLAHNIYIGRSKRFELLYSYSHGSKTGHLVKSRARENLISYNRLTDEQGGRSSYIVDIPEGGRAAIIGNVIEQRAETFNHGMISYAGESGKHPENRLLIVNNSIYNRDFKALIVRNRRDLDVVMVNNLLGGAPAASTDTMIELDNNMTRPDHGMTDPRNYEFGLVAGAPAIDSGVDFEVVPTKEYVHPVRWRMRQSVWRLDVGAYERCGID